MTNTNITLDRTIAPSWINKTEANTDNNELNSRSIASMVSLLSAKNKLEAVLITQMNESEDSIVQFGQNIFENIK